MRQCSNLIRVSNILRFHHPKILQFLQVLIAPLFVPIFVLSRGGDDGNTRKKKERKKREEEAGKKAKEEEKSFSQPTPARSSSPLHLRALLRHRFSDALHLFIGTRAGLLSLSLFFRVPPPLLHDAHCASSVAANEPRPLSCQECNFRDDSSSKNEYRVTYLIMAGTITFAFFRVIFGGNFDVRISFQNE